MIKKNTLKVNYSDLFSNKISKKESSPFCDISDKMIIFLRKCLYSISYHILTIFEETKYQWVANIRISTYCEFIVFKIHKSIIQILHRLCLLLFVVWCKTWTNLFTKSYNKQILKARLCLKHLKGWILRYLLFITFLDKWAT